MRQMNLRAAALGLADTHYANPIGLDQAGNYSSARDLTALAAGCCASPPSPGSPPRAAPRLRSLRPPRRIETLNDLLLEEPWATGVKTGHTFDAGYVLVGSGRRRGVELISAVIGARPRTPATGRPRAARLRLLPVPQAGADPRRRRTSPSPRSATRAASCRCGPARTVAVGLRRGQRLEVRVRAPEEVEGPIHRGAGLGRAIVLVDGLRAASTPLRAGRAVPEASALTGCAASSPTTRSGSAGAVRDTDRGSSPEAPCGTAR